MERGKPKQEDYTLCWECARAYGLCSWSKDFIPVAGWDATPTQNKRTSSYNVHSCPLFIKEKRRVKP